MKYLVVVFNIAILFTVLSGCSVLPERTRNVSWQKMKWQNVNRQIYDYSCGAGALSTLIEFYFHDAAPEPFILDDMFGRLSPEVLENRLDRGFSMQDLKVQAEHMGYLAAGVKLQPEALVALKGPVIVLLEGREINHFVIVKGVINNRVYLADPARGNIWLHFDDFLVQWKSRLALILGKKAYGLPTDHLLALDQDLAPEWVTPEDVTIRNQYRQFQISFLESSFLLKLLSHSKKSRAIFFKRQVQKHRLFS